LEGSQKVQRDEPVVEVNFPLLHGVQGVPPVEQVPIGQVEYDVAPADDPVIVFFNDIVVVVVV